MRSRMPARGVRRNHKLPLKRNSAASPMSKTAWLSAPIGAVIIVGLAAAASFAQSTEAVLIAAPLVFSFGGGVVLAAARDTLSRRGACSAGVRPVGTAGDGRPAA